MDYQAWELGVLKSLKTGLIMLLLTAGITAIPLIGKADVVSVSCSSATVNASSSGGTYTANVDCIINAPNATSSYRITPSNSNFVQPTSLLLLNGLYSLTATRQSSVSSPDGSVTSISGSAGGFTAHVSNSSAPKTVRFQYQVSTNSSTPSGTYTNLNTLYYQYSICTTPSCNNSFTSTASSNLSIKIAASPVSVSCTSPTLNATPGGGTFTLSVVCTATGGNPSLFSPSNQNKFSPTTMTLNQGSSTLSATLQPLVTSPDNSVTNISGTASGGFTGTINAMPAKVQVQYAGTTLNSTPAGTYTSTPVTWVWATL